MVTKHAFDDGTVIELDDESDFIEADSDEQAAELIAKYEAESGSCDYSQFEPVPDDVGDDEYAPEPEIGPDPTSEDEDAGGDDE